MPQSNSPLTDIGLGLDGGGDDPLTMRLDDEEAKRKKRLAAAEQQGAGGQSGGIGNLMLGNALNLLGSFRG